VVRELGLRLSPIKPALGVGFSAGNGFVATGDGRAGVCVGAPALGVAIDGSVATGTGEVVGEPVLVGTAVLVGLAVGEAVTRGVGFTTGRGAGVGVLVCVGLGVGVAVGVTAASKQTVLDESPSILPG
jgi:hypothetical protein